MNTAKAAFFELSKTEINLKRYYEDHPELHLDKPHDEDEVMDVLNRCYVNDNARINTFSTTINEQAFIPEYMDIAFVRHMRYTPAFWHTHEFFELLCVLDGECNNIFSDTEIKMVPGDICIHSPRTTHTVSAFSDDCILMNILMRRSTFENSFMSLLRSDSILSNFFNRAFFNTTDIPYLLFHTNKDPLIEKYIMDSYSEASSLHRYRKEMVNAQISQLIIYLLQKFESSIEIPSINMEKRDSNFIYMLRYLQANYATITLPELAAFFNYSERQIQRIIFSATGMSFSENIQKQKIERVCYLLAESDRSITEISEEVGYVSLNNFRKIFRKHVGVTPSEFRKAKNHEMG